MSDFLRKDSLNLNYNPDTVIAENEIAELILSIQEAQYFDASSMAPLSARSLVCAVIPE
jgi:hypothetical protein